MTYPNSSHVPMTERGCHLSLVISALLVSVPLNFDCEGSDVHSLAAPAL